MDANLLLFKTVIAGDSWGQIAVPVIQEYPLTSIIFCGSLFTLVFGVLNLIVAVARLCLYKQSFWSQLIVYPNSVHNRGSFLWWVLA